MEHLQLVSGARRPTLSIPIVVKSASEFPYTFGQGDFIHFARHHLREIQFIHQELSPRNAFSSLVQSWLYFGTLTEFLKRSVSIECLSRLDAAGDRVLCTSAFGDLRARWIASLPRRCYFSAGIRQLESRRCAVLLARATWVYTQMEHAAVDDALLQRILFSVKLMLTSLCQTVRIVLGPTPTLDAILTSLAFRRAGVGGSLKTDFLLWGYMVGNGWCPYQMNNLLRVHTPTSMVYLASMKRKGRQRSHHDCQGAGYCKATQVDWAAFQTPHLTTTCTCAHVAVDEQQIIAKIEDDKIPLLSCTRDASGDFSIELVHVNMQGLFGSRTRYFAVSHVWADGLGNPNANSLPKCQFEKLYDKLRALSKSAAMTGPLARLFQRSGAENGEIPIVFWMDVFCIPVQKPGCPRHEKLKNRAITLMDLIYSCAHQVLVLDSEMEYATMNHGGGDESNRLKSSTEALARFATSNWMGRSWTLQEGALAAALWAYYAGSLTRHKSFNAFHVPSYLADEAPSELLAVIEELQNRASLPFVGRSARDMTNAAMYCHSERELQFLQVWNSLIGRSTTKPEDFHCIVANLLDFSVQELFKLKDSNKSDEENRYERMKAIILAQKRLPMQLFCLPRSSAHSAAKEMPWLPERPIEPRLPDEAFAHAVKISSDGFVVESPCLSSCLFAWPAQGSTNSFCLNIPTRNAAHPTISLELAEATDIAKLDLLMYLNTLPKAHSLQSDCRRTGAAFVVVKRQATSVTVRYLCPLTFQHCWDDHRCADSSDYVPGATVNKNTSILISGPNSYKALKFRRPLRFGSGLVATTLSKVVSYSSLFGLGGGLLVILFLFSPLVRNRILDPPVAPHLLPIMYLLLTSMLLQYLMVLAFICAKHLSAPWIRETYFTDKLPWYLRALYSEKLPTETKAIMTLRRIHNAFITRFIYKHAAYDIRVDRPAGLRIRLLARLHRAIPALRMRSNAVVIGQEYADDYGPNIPLLPIGESDHPFRDFPVSPSPPSQPDSDDIGTFDCLSHDNAVRLRLIQLTLIETRREDTGRSFWDGIVNVAVAILWLGRIDSRRGVLDFLYDMGITMRRRRGSGNEAGR